jgi:hypothetical protein
MPPRTAPTTELDRAESSRLIAGRAYCLKRRANLCEVRHRQRADTPATVGVPEITPAPGASISPAGSVPEKMDQV